MKSFNIQYTKQLLESYIKRSHLFEKCFSNNEYIQGFKYLPSTSQLSPEKLSLHLHFFFPGLLSSSTQVPSFWQSLSSLQRFLSNFMQKDKKHVSYKIDIIIIKYFHILSNCYKVISRDAIYFKNISQTMNTFKALSTYFVFDIDLPHSQVGSYTQNLLRHCYSKFLHFCIRCL